MKLRDSARAIVSLGLLFAAVLFPLQSIALAQSTNGRIAVTVKDLNGDIIPAAVVTITNEGTASEDIGETGEKTGAVLFSQVPVGLYTVSVGATGFKSKITQGVKIDVGQEYSLLVTLEPGGVGESVTVVAGEELVHASTTDLTNTVSTKQIQDLPLDGRDPLSLVNLQAGTFANGRSNTSINGQRVSSVEATQDGINIQDNFIRAGGFEVTTTRTTVSSVAEFSVTTSNAQVDSAGASAVRLVTPSGTNELHGTVFEFNRNDALSANDWFNNAATPSIERPKLNRNQFGFTLGGPIYIPKVYEHKDKLFFFQSYEGQRQVSGTPVDTVVLTPEARAGTFRYFDNSGRLRSVNILRLGGFQADPVVQQLLTEVPQINNNDQFGDGLNTYGYSFNKNLIFNRNQSVTRIDYQMTDKHRFEAVFQYTGEQVSRDDIDTSFRVTPAAQQNASNFFGVFAWNWTINDKFVNEVRAGLNNSTVPFFLTEDRELPYVVVLPLITDPYLDTAQIAPQGRRTITSSFIDSASYSWGNHFFRFGGQIDDIRVRSYSTFGNLPELDLGFSVRAPGGTRLVAGDFEGGISTTQLSTANGLLALQAGIVGTSNQTFEVTSQDSGFVPGAQNVRNFVIRRYSSYFADTWRITPQLTVVAGLRWDYLSPLRETQNLSLLPVTNGRSAKETVLDPNGVVDYVNGFYFEPDRNNFAPNIGAAWDIFGDGKTVLRGAYSLAYINDEAIRSFDNASDANNGLSSTVSGSVYATISGGNFNGNPTPSRFDLFNTFLVPGQFQVPISYADNFALNSGSAAFIVNPQFKSPYYQQWNISLEREIGWNTVVSARYVGNASSNLARGVDYNQVDVTNNGFAADVARARTNGFLAQAVNGTFNPNYNPNIPGSQPLTVFPMLASGGLLSNPTIQFYLQTGEAGTLAQIYYTNGLQGSVAFTANPSTFVADVLDNFGESNYNSLQLEVQRRFTNGFGFQANYTWAKALTNASGLGQTKFEPPLDIYNPNQTRTRAEYDIPAAFKANAIYELPFGEGKKWADYDNKFLKQAVSGWQVSTIITYQSGGPFSILSARGTYNRVGRSGLNGADSTLTSDQIRDLFGHFQTPTGLYFINPSVINPQNTNDPSSTAPGGTNSDGSAPYSGQVFFNPGPGQIGSLQAFQFNGPNFFGLDLGIIKRFQTSETTNLELRFEFFNLPNHPNFFFGNQNINSPQFGQILSSFQQRVIQMAAKFNF